MFTKLNHIQCVATIVCLTLLLYSFPSVAQVTIGSTLKPKIGALLDLKENDGETTSNKGLGLLRVALISNKSLVPTIEVEHQNAVTEKQHIGLLLYNVGAEFLEYIDYQLCKGLHVCNGKKWSPLNPYPNHIFGQDVIRCVDEPSFTIDCNSINVVGVYKKIQFLIKAAMLKL